MSRHKIVTRKAPRQRQRHPIYWLADQYCSQITIPISVTYYPIISCHLHLLRVYIEALELHSQSSRLCNSSHCKAYSNCAVCSGLPVGFAGPASIFAALEPSFSVLPMLFVGVFVGLVSEPTVTFSRRFDIELAACSGEVAASSPCPSSVLEGLFFLDVLSLRDSNGLGQLGGLFSIELYEIFNALYIEQNSVRGWRWKFL